MQRQICKAVLSNDIYYNVAAVVLASSLRSIQHKQADRQAGRQAGRECFERNGRVLRHRMRCSVHSDVLPLANIDSSGTSGTCVPITA